MQRLRTPEETIANGYMYARPVRELSIDSNILPDTNEAIQERNPLNVPNALGNSLEGNIFDRCCLPLGITLI